MQTLLQKFKGSLIRSHRRRLALLRFHNILRNAFSFILFQNGKQLLRKRNHSFGRSCFRQVRDPAEIPFFISSVVASFVHRKRSFREINIRPSKCKQFSDTQTRIKTNHDPDEFPFLIRQRRLLYLLLLGKRKTGYFFLFRFRSSDFVCRILFQFSERRRRAGIKTKSSVRVLFFKKQVKMQLLNSNIPQGARTTKYSNKKAQDLLNLVLFLFCSFFVLQRWLSHTK